MWSRWIARDPVRFANVYLQNRTVLSRVKSWISTETLASSFWRYGVPLEWESSHTQELDCTGLPDAEAEITEADILGYLAGELGNLRYLEIGVSVGKNFIQMCNQTNAEEIVGLDIEEINPALKSCFVHSELLWRSTSSYKAETISGKLADKYTSLIKLGGKEEKPSVYYVSADQFRDDTWERLAGKKFNMIFSDAIHSPAALRSELEFLLKYDLIDRQKFIMMWDDLWDDGMQSAFLENAKTLCGIFGRGDDAIALSYLHGSYGPRRPVGLFVS